MKTFDKKYNFCIATYETVPNPLTQNLKTYLLENYSADILYIYHQMLDMKQGYDKSSGYEFFSDNKLVSSGKAYNFKLYWTILYLKDILYTLFWCLKFGKKFDLYFASGNLNPVAGLILRKMGVVKKVIYQSVDYYSIRFKNKFFNWLYFQMDKFCVKFCDETWNVSSMMAPAREKQMGMDMKIFNRQYTVPGGIWFYKTKRLVFTKINRKKIVYRGMLLEFMGIDLAIRAMPLLLKKIPDLKFEIIGTGEEENNLKNLAFSLGVSKNVLFHGFVKERADVERLLSDAAVGIATFNPNMPVDRVKNSDPGKIKDYMLLGMPVITTDTNTYSKEFIKNECGLVVDYDPKELASAIIKLLNNKELLKEYRNNAIKFIEKFDCINILKPNIERVLKETNNYYEN
ncbi:MAG: glycosyltransferase [Candidatus Daviesbacteria bacterium]|nr:glycosyltransferase [Candidatus Daviesbacteria bacterium]